MKTKMFIFILGLLTFATANAQETIVEVTKKKSAGPYLSSENAKKWPFIGTRESVA